MNTLLDKYDELAGVLSALGPEIDETEVTESIDAAINCKRDGKLHIIATIVGLHCGFESPEPCGPCSRGRQRILEAMQGTADDAWPEIFD